jgi:hypothetical protein
MDPMVTNAVPNRPSRLFCSLCPDDGPRDGPVSRCGAIHLSLPNDTAD